MITLTLSEAVASLRKRLTDDDCDGFTRDELVTYINDAIDFYCNELTAIKSAVFVKEISVANYDSVPEDFINFAGAFPVTISNNKFICLDKLPVSIRYFSHAPSVKVDTDTLPYDKTGNNIVIQLATIYALNRNEFNTSQDERLVNLLNQFVSSRGEK